MKPAVLAIYMVFGCLAIFMLMVIGHALRQRFRAKRYLRRSLKSKDDDSQMNWKVSLLLIVAILLIVFSFVAPVLLTKMEALDKDFDFSWTGQVGDTIGGLMNPFIALAGVIVTGLAFYMQYEANLQQRRIFREQLEEERRRFDLEMALSKQQVENQLAADRERFEDETRINREQFEDQLAAQAAESWVQQFENRFYEMLRLHKENVNEMEIPAKRLTGSGFEAKYESYLISKRNVFGEFKRELEEILNEMEELGQEIDLEKFREAYHIFFWGVGEGPEYVDSQAEMDEPSILGHLRTRRYNQYVLFNREASENQSPLDIAAFSGHSGFLGHYYRHLYMIVKFVAEQPSERLKFKEKKAYLKILRTQLSNYEQAMLFYNWLGGYGRDWQNDTNSFFVDYKMIHNLWYDALYPCDFIGGKIAELKAMPRRKAKGELFEIDEKGKR